MKPIKVLLLSLCLLALVAQHALAQESAAAGRIRRRATAIPNNYIVVFKDSVPQGRVNAFAAQLARTHGGTINFTYQHALRGFSVELSEAQALALSRNPQVEYVEEDTLVEGAGVQSNPTWALDRIDQRNLPLNASYNYANSGAGVNAYIIDSGIRLTHQEFGARAAFAYDNVGDGRNGVDCNGHGTHVAGVVGGKTYGVAKDAKLWSVRVLSCLNQGTMARNIAGVDWVAANHIKPAVANLSFTGVGSDALDLSVRNLIAAGVTTIVAAGNNTGDASLRSPARVTEAITVAATDQFDNQSPNSNFGPVVDIYAPGVEIVSAWSWDDAAIHTRSGTSSAAAFVAGLAARYLASRPGDQPDTVSQAILNAATPGKVVNPGVGSPNLLAYGAITLSDDFNDNVRDAAKWLTPTATDFTIAEQNGQLSITPGSAGHEGYTSVNTIDLTDARATIEGISAPLLAGCASYFELIDPSTRNMLLVGVSGGAFMMEQHVGGVLSRVWINYDAAQHRFWRIRHNRANDTINWETSPDNITWTTRRSSPRPFPITNLQTALIAGRDSLAAPSVTVIFDNLQIERNEGGPAGTGDGSGSSYNAVTDFSPTQNPTGHWAYGYKPPSGAFTLFGSASNAFGAGTHTWAMYSYGGCPMVTKNSTGSTYTNVNVPSVVHPADVLNLHPGPNGERSVVRWTAPTAGDHMLSGRFQGLDTVGTTSDVLITHNGITIFSGNINGYGTEAPFSLTRTVAAGDIVEFSVGYGENLNYNSDSTGLATTINQLEDEPQVNKAPQVNAGLDATVNEGSTFIGTASFTDIDNTENWTITVDYGDGTGVQPVTPTLSKTVPLSHVYKDNAANPYTVTVTVTDAAGASASDTALVWSVNVPPTMRLEDTPSTCPAGYRIKFASIVGDPSQADTEAGFMYLWTVTKNSVAYAQNAPGAGALNDTRYDITPEEEGTYVVTLRVTDKDGGAVTLSRTIIVTKIEPSDDFNDNWRNIARWYLAGTPDVAVWERHGQLQVTTPGSTAVGYDGYYARTGIDMTNQGVIVEAVQPAFGDGLDTYFVLEDKTNSAQNRLLFKVGGASGSLRMEERYFSGTYASISTQIPYDATQHRFWRFRHDAATDTIKWETSAEGLAWTVRHSAARAFSLTNMQAQLYAGRSTTTTPPMKAIFDNYRIGLVPYSLNENFDDNLLDTAVWKVLDPVSPLSVREQNQRLEMVHQPYSSNYINGIESSWFYNFWEKRLQVEIPQAGGAASSFSLKLNEYNYYQIRASGMLLLCEASTNGVIEREHFIYSASAHRFQRFRHDGAANTMSFEVSPDGTTWTTLKTVQVRFSLNALKVALEGQGTGSETPSATVFDNLRMLANR